MHGEQDNPGMSKEEFMRRVDELSSGYIDEAIDVINRIKLAFAESIAGKVMRELHEQKHSAG